MCELLPHIDYVVIVC